MPCLSRVRVSALVCGAIEAQPFRRTRDYLTRVLDILRVEWEDLTPCRAVGCQCFVSAIAVIDYEFRGRLEAFFELVCIHPSPAELAILAALQQ